MIIKCKSFENNGMIPKKHTGFGEDKSPELMLNDIPKTEIIPEGLPRGEKIGCPIGAIQGNAWGKHIYRGPKQPFFIRKEHRERVNWLTP